MFCVSKQQLSSLRSPTQIINVAASRHADHPGNMQDLTVEQQAMASLL